MNSPQAVKVSQSVTSRASLIYGPWTPGSSAQSTNKSRSSSCMFTQPSPLRADDLLKEDLRLEDDDLDLDVATEVDERTGRSLDNASANPYFGKVQTVRDLVLFFQAQARSGAA